MSGKICLLFSALLIAFVTSMLLTASAEADLSEERQLLYKKYAVAEANEPVIPRNPFMMDQNDTEEARRNYEEWWRTRFERLGIHVPYLEDIQTFSKTSARSILADGSHVNKLYSPINTWLYLRLLSNIMDGNSLVQVSDLLGLEGGKNLMDGDDALYRALYWDDDFTVCRPASSIWISEQTHLSETLRSKFAEKSHASVYQGPMGEPSFDEAFQAWLNHQTNHLLEGVVNDLRLNGETGISVCSTLYMRCAWSLPFERDRTYSDVFFSTDGEKIADYMYKEEGGSAVYMGNGFSSVMMDLQEGSHVVLILPDAGKTNQEIFQSDELYDFLFSGAEWADKKYGKIRISVPRMDIFASVSLEDLLIRMGVTDLFDPEKAVFSREIISEDGLRIDSMGQYSRFIMNEDGIEAASMIASDSATFQIPGEEEIDFVLNRPFIFSVLSGTNIPLFIGEYSSP